MLTVQRVPRIPKPAKTGSITDSEREELDRAKVDETQGNVDSGGAVEMSAPKEDPGQQKECTSGSSSSLTSSSDYSQGSDIVVKGLTEDMTTVLIRACVSMISVPVDPDTLHATLRLCLRLTRNHHYAMMFAELKSTRMILGLTQSSGFNGFTPLVTLLFRHIIEDPATLRHTMEKVCFFPELYLNGAHLYEDIVASLYFHHKFLLTMIFFPKSVVIGCEVSCDQRSRQYHLRSGVGQPWFQRNQLYPKSPGPRSLP